MAVKSRCNNAVPTTLIIFIPIIPTTTTPLQGYMVAQVSLKDYIMVTKNTLGKKLRGSGIIKPCPNSTPHL